MYYQKNRKVLFPSSFHQNWIQFPFIPANEVTSFLSLFLDKAFLRLKSSVIDLSPMLNSDVFEPGDCSPFFGEVFSIYFTSGKVWYKPLLQQIFHKGTLTYQ